MVAVMLLLKLWAYQGPMFNIIWILSFYTNEKDYDWEGERAREREREQANQFDKRMNKFNWVNTCVSRCHHFVDHIQSLSHR